MLQEIVRVIRVKGQETGNLYISPKFMKIHKLQPTIITIGKTLIGFFLSVNNVQTLVFKFSEHFKKR